MKKTLYLFSVLAVVFALTVFAFAANTETVVYLETGATGNGTSADSPVGSLGKAVELLDKSKDGTIVVCGNFVQSGIFTYPEEFTGSITITSVYDGVDYRKFGAVYDCVGARFVCSGEYIFKDIDIKLSGKYMFVIANHNPFTIDTGVTVTAADAATDGLGFGTSLGILGGYQSGQPELRGVKDPPPAEDDSDINITVLSGSKICIGGYSRQVDGAYYMGTSNITVGGDANVGRVFLTPANKPYTCGNINLTVKDNAAVSEVYASTSTGFAENLTLNWEGGSIGKYSDRLTSGNDIIFTNGKTLTHSEAVKNSASFAAISAQFDKVVGAGEEAAKTTSTEVKLTIGSTTAYINGKAQTLDAAPINRNNRTMLPVRFLANAFGVANEGIKWDAQTRTATLTNSEVTVVVTIDAPTMTVNGETVALDSPAIIENNRTYLPVRAIANALGVSNDNIKWDGATSTATLTKTGTASAVPAVGNNTAEGLNLHTIAELNAEAPSADSHKDFSAFSSVELNFREYTEINPSLLLTGSATYPRIKQMKNGEFILFYQNGQIGSNIYYSISPDAVSFEKANVLFKVRAAENIEGKQDSVRYSTCDAVVLDNGDILAVASFRYNLGYAIDASQGGLAMRRSSDNGKTWSEEEVIYTGINWEPYLTTTNGEIQLFFTHNAPKFYLDGKIDKDYLSSGVGMIRSSDNGKTWTPNVTTAPYSASIVMQQKRNVNASKTLFTDQMPSVVHLNNGTSVMAVESRPDAGELYISLGYSADNWTATIDTEGVGPKKRADNIFEGAAPYIMQFDSGETLLSYNVSSRFSVRVGDASGENFGESILPFGKTGYWGTLEKRSSHSVIGSMANVASDSTNTLMVGTMYLNHAINAAENKVTVDGNNAEWSGNTEALFIGSDTQAQVAIRAAKDGDNLYLLFERADYYLTKGDTITLYLADKSTGGFWRIRIGSGGIEEFVLSGEKLEKRDSSEIGYAAKEIGTVDNPSDTDTGKIIEISVPMSIFTSKVIRINATLMNQDKNENKTSDSFSSAKLSSTENWPRILVK